MGKKKEFCCRLGQHGGKYIVCACDRDILGSSFKKGDVCIKVEKSFYLGEYVDKKVLLNRLFLGDIVNLVGNNTVDIAIDAGLVDLDNIMKIEGVKHAQIIYF